MTETVASRSASLDAWLFDVVLPHWLDASVNPGTGVSVECLDMDGSAMPEVARRGRVTPRQLFTFARARRLGFGQAKRVDPILAAGAATLSRVSYDPERGFPSEIGADGRGTAYDAVLYDHAFNALAGAELQALGIAGGQRLSELAFDFIDAHFRDAVHGGYHAKADTPERKLSNPHMHLLEASLLHYDVTNSQASRDRIAEIAGICRDHFIDAETGLLAEQCETDLSPSSDNWVEPGHCFEWAYLLHRAADVLDDPATRTLARELFERSEQFVEADGLVVDRLEADSPTYRLWPQLERLRCLGTFEKHEPIEPLLETLERAYVSRGPDAGWMDKLDADREPLSERVPASMLYHFMTAIPVVSRPDRLF